MQAELAELRGRECATCGENPAIRNERIECYLTDATGEELRAALGIPEPGEKCSRCKGERYIGEPRSIAGVKPCPDCMGTGEKR